jgi:selenium metabolism protein YedF
MCGGDGYKAIFITRDTIGEGERLLGEKLMSAWCSHLARAESVPSVICFMNSGIRLCLEGHPCTEHLAELQQAGVRLLVCGTCLDFYNAADNMAVGERSNMPEIQRTLLEAENTFTI